MKRIVLLAIIIAGSNFSLLSQNKTSEVKWYTFQEAVELSKQKPKKLFIDVYTDWCGWCKKMDSETFTHPVIANYLNEHFYAVKFNAESTKPVDFAGHTFINEGGGSRNPHQLAIALLQGQMSYPSVAYMNEELQLLTAVPGYYTPDRLEPILSYFAKDSYKTIGWAEFQTTFVSEIKE